VYLKDVVCTTMYAKVSWLDTSCQKQDRIILVYYVQVGKQCH
jgi:hypothetical protein